MKKIEIKIIETLIYNGKDELASLLNYCQYELNESGTVMLQVEMEFLNYYICKLKERKFHHVREKTIHLRSEDYYSQGALILQYYGDLYKVIYVRA